MQNVVRWWPVLLLAAGLGLLIGSIQRPTPVAAEPAATAKKRPPIPAAKITPVTDAPATVTPVAEPTSTTPTTLNASAPPPAVAPSNEEPTPPAAPARNEPVDIYEFLKQQPPEPNTSGEDEQKS